MAAPFYTPAGLTKSQHTFFLYYLRNTVHYGPAVLMDGQTHENSWYSGGTHVAISDTDRNTKTDKKGKRQRWGTVTIELIATDPQYRGQGAATHQLNALANLADKWNITLCLRPLAQKGSGLTDEQLTAWYQRLGYTEQDGLYLNRLPAEQRRAAAKAAGLTLAA